MSVEWSRAAAQRFKSITSAGSPSKFRVRFNSRIARASSGSIFSASLAFIASTAFVFGSSGAASDVLFDGVPTVNVPWSLADEVSLFNTCDVGVYPLTDDEWSKGKCGFKAIQFMSCGVPVVAAAVGVNREIIQDGVNGFLASSDDEWVAKVGRLLENPELISETVLELGLEKHTSFEIVSIDIADIDVGDNIGARLQADQAEADTRVAQAKAEQKRAEMAAKEQEMFAMVQESRAKVVLAEAEVPQAISAAFRSGKLGLMDYYELNNVQADTKMRTSIAGDGPSASARG